MNFIKKNCWTNDALEKYFTTESRQKDKEAFNKTHLLIDKIEAVEPPLNISEKFITEKEFLNQIILNTELEEGKKTYIIEGETGSGKSEFCQWMEYNLPEDRVPILFSRTHTSIKQIFDKLSEFTGDNYSIEEDLNNFKISTLLDYITIECNLFYQSQDSKDKKLRRLKGNYLNYFKKIFEHEKFEVYLEKNLAEYQGNEEKLLKSYEPIKISQLEAIVKDLNLNLSDDKITEFNKIVRTFLNNQFIERFGSEENINQILVDLSKNYYKKDKRLVLIFEDITSMGIYKDQILQFIFDKSIGKVDIIVGVTTGFVRKNNLKKSTYMDRTDGYFSLTSPDGKYTYFLEEDPEDIIALSLKYMKAIKNNCSNCEIKDECFKTFGDYLYPFTKESLIDIYNNLIEENNPKRTPRLFLEKVQKKILYDRTFPFRNPFIKEVKGNFQSKVLEEFPIITKLFNIYGEEIYIKDEETIYMCIPENLPRYFSIDIEDLDENNTGILNRDGKICLKTKRVKKEEKPKDTSKDKKEKEILKTKREEFASWIINGGNFPYGEDLRDSITTILTSKYDFLEYFSTTQGESINYRYSSKIPLFIEDIDSIRQEDIIRLKIPRETSNDLLDFAFEFALNGNNDDFDKVCDRILDSRYLLFDWINNNKKRYLKQIKSNIKEHLNGIDLELIAIFGKCLMQNIFFGKDITNFSNITEDLSSKENPKINKYCPNCGTYLNGIRCHNCYSFSNPPLKVEDLNELKQKIDYFEQFFNIMFGLGKDIVNYNSLIKHYRHYNENFTSFIEKFSDIDYHKINSRIVVSFQNGEKIQLSKFIQLLYDTHHNLSYELEENRILEDLDNLMERLRDVSEYQEGFTKDMLEEKIEKLQNNYQGMWKEEWSNNLQLDNCNFDEFFNFLNKNITFIEELNKNEGYSIFDLASFITNYARNIGKSQELTVFKTINEIFKRIERHERKIEHSGYNDQLNNLNDLKEELISLLNKIKEELLGNE